MAAYLPATLPPINAVDVISLRDVDANRVDQFMQNTGDLPTVSVGKEEAQRVAELWRGLPPGQQSRCHIPPYGVRFRLGDRIVCQASLCWECGNIFGEADGQHIHYEFDAANPTSKELLARLHRAFGDVESG